MIQCGPPAGITAHQMGATSATPEAPAPTQVAAIHVGGAPAIRQDHLGAV